MALPRVRPRGIPLDPRCDAISRLRAGIDWTDMPCEFTPKEAPGPADDCSEKSLSVNEPVGVGARWYGRRRPEA